MTIIRDLEPLLENIPHAEHVYVKRLLQYQLTLISLMPEQQRFAEYSRAEMALVHFEQYTAQHGKDVPTEG